MAAEHCAKQYKFTREAQDAYTFETFRRAQDAQKNGRFKDEIAPILVKTKAGEVLVSEDEGPAKLRKEKVPTLKPAFTKEGTVTAANSSSLNDGACALVLASEDYATSKGLKPLARIIGYADAQQNGIDFTTTPALAIPKALKMAGITLAQLDAVEINEAFAVVAMANTQVRSLAHTRITRHASSTLPSAFLLCLTFCLFVCLFVPQILGLDAAKLNINGGAVALGHPIGPRTRLHTHICMCFVSFVSFVLFSCSHHCLFVFLCPCLFLL